MPRQSNFSRIVKDIEKIMESRQERVLKKSDITTVFENNRDYWRLPVMMSGDEFLMELGKKTKLKKVTLKFPSESFTRYLWGDASVFEIAQTVVSGGYLCCHSAIYLHELTEQIPKKVYLRREHGRALNRGDLDQESIRLAFSRVQRVTRNIAKYGNFEIYYLYGKECDNVGTMRLEASPFIRVTDIERTLIDAVVRPVYAGGVAEVLSVFRKGRSKVSINKLASYLRKMNYIYPYHQAIGFYLERTGYSRTQISLMNKLAKNYDFYLDYGMKEMEYSKKWRLFFPKGF